MLNRSFSPFHGAWACLAVAAVFVVGSPAAHGQFILDPTVNVVAGAQPSGIASGDFDGDGDNDLATTIEAPDRIIVLVNNGAGSFVAGPMTFLPASSSPQDIFGGDLNGDGLDDVAVAVRDPAGAVLIMINAGAGTFVQSASVSVGDRPIGLDIADIDGDGDMDVGCANRDSDQASVITNNGGVFSGSTFAVGGEPRKVTFANFAGDANLDLAVTNHDDRTVGLYQNNGGAFGFIGTLSVGPIVRPEGIDAADLDNDGDVDLAVGTSDQTLNINQATIFVNNGGTFGGPFNYPTGGLETGQIVAADFDCDGLMDLATSNKTSNNVSLLRNLGAATFGPAMLATAGTTPEEITSSDFDGDGDPDLATANRDSGNVSVIINQTCAIVDCPCLGDLDDDGSTTFADLVLFLDCVSVPGEGCACGDMDGDGSVTFADLVLFLDVLATGGCG